MDVHFFKPFIVGTQHTLKIQCNLECKPQKPFIKSNAHRVKFDIAGVIGLTSSAFTGTIALCFPKEVFLTLMSNMLGETYTEINDDMQDGAAELLNIIFGQAKIVLNEKNYRIDKAIPTVVRGTQMETFHMSDHPVFVLPFETSAGVFYIEIAMEERSAKSDAA
jgi:chemotaxis protein CheX